MTNVEKSPNYWLVASMLGGRKEGDIFQDCIERGYWYCWEPDAVFEESQKVEEMRNLLRSINSGDRIAIKKQLGSGENAPFIEIRAIGIVKIVDTEEWRVYVDWLLPLKGDYTKEMSRRVPKKGPGGISSISGPFKNNEINHDWLPNIFCI
ncbi:MAG: hypothetical protein U1B30_09345 [Pseudomonadota bacterium]|nr:hypothetical protein [Pseudomonadota bacterium]